MTRWPAFCQPPNSYTTSWDSTLPVSGLGVGLPSGWCPAVPVQLCCLCLWSSSSPAQLPCCSPGDLASVQLTPSLLPRCSPVAAPPGLCFGLPALVSLLWSPCSPVPPCFRASITPLNGTDLLCKWTRTASCLSILGFYLIPPTVCRSAGRCTNSQTRMLFLLHVVLLCTDCHKVAIFGCFITTQVLICLHVITPLWVLIMRICITSRY